MNQAQTSSNIKALNKYASVNIQTGVDDASPHRLIQMLMEGALSTITVAKTSIKQNHVAKKGESIGRAISIIGGLRDSLDFDVNSEIANNLDNLYEYMTFQLLQANINNDVAILDEVSTLLLQIKQAWDAVPEVEQLNKTANAK